MGALGAFDHMGVLRSALPTTGEGAAAGQLLGATKDDDTKGGFDFEGWLRTRGLWEAAKSRGEMEVRYRRLKGVKFGLVPEEEQGRYLQQLLPWEHGFWHG